MANLFKAINKKMTLWVNRYQAGFFIFIFLLLILVTLHSIGYFDPFLRITASIIIVFAMIASIFLLGVRKKQMVILTLTFWMLGLFFKFLHIDIWAERIGIYVFYSLLLFIILFIIESINRKR